MKKITEYFWYFIGFVSGLLSAVRDTIRFYRWSNLWRREHPTASDDIHREYALRWWAERDPEVKIKLEELLKKSS